MVPTLVADLQLQRDLEAFGRLARSLAEEADLREGRVRADRCARAGVLRSAPPGCPSTRTGRRSWEPTPTMQRAVTFSLIVVSTPRRIAAFFSHSSYFIRYASCDQAFSRFNSEKRNEPFTTSSMKSPLLCLSSLPVTIGTTRCTATLGTRWPWSPL